MTANQKVLETKLKDKETIYAMVYGRAFVAWLLEPN
jgi:hypothetical protein